MWSFYTSFKCHRVEAEAYFLSSVLSSIPVGPKFSNALPISNPSHNPFSLYELGKIVVLPEVVFLF